MKKIIFENKFILACIVISIIGFLGYFSPYGYEEWNFLFENLAWFPLELMVTVLILEKILDSKREQRESYREKRRFIDLAGYKTNDLIKILKENLCSAYTGKSLTGKNDMDELNLNLNDLYANFDDIFTLEYFDRGYDSLKLNVNDLFDSFNHPINISYPESILNFSIELNTKTEEYIAKNHYILPEEVFDEMIVLRNTFQESNIFNVGSMTPIIMNALKEVKDSVVDEESKLYLISEFKEIYIKTYSSLIRLEEILNNMPPAK